MGSRDHSSVMNRLYGVSNTLAQNRSGYHPPSYIHPRTYDPYGNSLNQRDEYRPSYAAHSMASDPRNYMADVANDYEVYRYIC